MRRSDPELILKATPPRSQKMALPRSRLASHGSPFADKMVIEVNAPAGFGKSSLLSQWRRECLSRGAIVAWLTLDERDDVARFVQGLSVAMDIASGKPTFSSMLERVVVQPGGELEVLTGWLAEVADMGGEVVLILDEAHTLPQATVQQLLPYLIFNAPPNLTLLFASRRNLALPVEELIGHGEYVCVNEDMLRFDVSETIAVLAARFGTRLSHDNCVRLHELTEGWPLGLQLAITTLEQSQNLSEALSQLSAPRSNISRYFESCLIAALPAEQVEFLLLISELEVLHPELCQAVSAATDAKEILAALRNSAPIFSAGVDSDWVRLHPLVREFLRERFRKLPAEQKQSAHLRACHWLAEHNMLEEAARHALAGGQTELACELAERSLYDLMLRGEFARVLEWVERLPAGEAVQRPSMRLAAAWALAMGYRHDEAAAFIAPLLEDPAVDEAYRCEAAAIASASAFFDDHPDDSYRIVTPWLNGKPPSEKLKAMLANQAAQFALLQGNPEMARFHCLRINSFYWSSHYDAIRAYGEALTGLTYWWEGQVKLAEEILRPSLLRAQSAIGRRSAMTVAMAVELAAVLFEQGQIAEAATILANRLDNIERVAAPEIIVLGYITAARIAVAERQERRAFDLLEALHALGEGTGFPRYAVAALTEMIRMHALRSHTDTCHSLLKRLNKIELGELLKLPMLGAEIALQHAMAQCWVAMSQRNADKLLQALQVASGRADHLRRGRESIQIKLLKGLALKWQGAGQDGIILLDEACSLARLYGLNRILEDTHPELSHWSPVTKQVGQDDPVAPPQRQVAQTKQNVPMVNVSPSRLLTPKEREVLTLLAHNLTNKEIASALNVGEETIKWHLKNLLGKFNATNRRHVVNKARMLGILVEENQ